MIQWISFAYVAILFCLPLCVAVIPQAYTSATMALVIGICALVYAVRSAFGYVDLAILHRPLILSVGLLILVSTISYLLADNYGSMWWGQHFEFGTIGANVLFSLALLGAHFSSETYKRRALRLVVFAASICSICLLFGVFFDALPQLSGKWPVLSCALTVAALVALIQASMESGRSRLVNVAALLLMCLALAMVPHTAALVSMMCASGAVFFFMLMRKSFVSALAACALAIFAAAMIAWGPHAPLASADPDIQPSAFATHMTVLPMLFSSPAHILLGAGPHSFGSTWDEFHPATFNATPFWNSQFQEGSSSFLTYIATYGMIGVFVMCSILISSLVRVSPAENNDYRIAYIAGSVALVINFVLYPIGAELFIVLGFFLGASAAMYHQPRSDSASVRRLAPLSVIIALPTLCFAGTICYVAPMQIIAAMYSERAQTVQLISEGSLSTLREAAFSVWPSPEYRIELARAHMQTALAVTEEIGKQKGTLDARFAEAVDEAIDHINTSVAYNLQDYDAWLLRARIYMSFDVEDADIEAAASLEQMKKLAPIRPETYYLSAVLAQRQGDTQKARDEVRRALDLKPDYAPAAELERTL